MEVEVKLGILVVVLQAEVEQHESKEVGHIDVVEDSEANNNVDEVSLLIMLLLLLLFYYFILINNSRNQRRECKEFWNRVLLKL